MLILFKNFKGEKDAHTSGMAIIARQMFITTTSSRKFGERFDLFQLLFINRGSQARWFDLDETFNDSLSRST